MRHRLATMLEELDNGPRDVQDIPALADMDPDQVDRILTFLEEQGCIDVRGVGGRRIVMLRSPSALPETLPNGLEDQDGKLPDDTKDGSGDTGKDIDTGQVDDSQPSSATTSHLTGSLPTEDPDTGSDASGSTSSRRTFETRPRTIGVVSGKGGVGKTVVTANLGAAMNDLGERVIVLDADSEMSNLSLQLGMHTFPTPLEEVLKEGAHLMSAIQIEPASGLKVIPTSLAAKPLPDRIEDVFSMIPPDYTLLIDSPPGFERPLERVIETSDELIFVTTPEITSATDTYKLAREARERGKEVLGAVVNMYSSEKNHLSLEEVKETIDLPILGVIEESRHVQRSIMNEEPVLTHKPYSDPARGFKQIAADITGREYDEGLFDRLRGMIHR